MDPNGDFQTSLLAQMQITARSLEALVKIVDKINVAVFGNGDVKKSLIWRMEQVDTNVAAVKQELAALHAQFNHDISQIRDDLKKGQIAFEELEKRDSLQEKGTANLTWLNKSFGWMGQSWKNFLIGGGVVALVVYVIASIAINVPPATLIGWLISSLSKFLA